MNVAGYECEELNQTCSASNILMAKSARAQLQYTWILKAAITRVGAVGFYLVVEESKLSLLFSFSETAGSITISQIDYRYTTRGVN